MKRRRPPAARLRGPTALRRTALRHPDSTGAASRARTSRQAAGAARAKSRRSLGLAALALLCCGLALLWLRQRPAPPAPAPAALAAPPPEAPPAPDAHAHAPPKPARKRPASAPPAPAPEVDRAALLAAVRARLAELSACPLQPGEPVRVPVRLRVDRDGRVQGATLPARLPAALASCLRERLLPWRLEGVALPAPQDVDVTLALRAG